MIEDVEAAEKARRAAMVAGDVATLQRLIAADALYIHMNGWRETGAEYIEAVRNGRYRYRNAELKDSRIRVIGEVAIVTGTLILDALLPDDNVQTVPIQCVVIWEWRANQWTMLHYQGTPPDSR